MIVFYEGTCEKCATRHGVLVESDPDTDPGWLTVLCRKCATAVAVEAAALHNDLLSDALTQLADVLAREQKPTLAGRLLSARNVLDFMQEKAELEETSESETQDEGEQVYTREQLIELCEAGLRPQEVWTDRDSEGAQRQLGEAAVLLKAGCTFVIEKDDPVTDDRTIWVRAWSEGFQYFEIGERRKSLFYIPTRARLDEVGKKDWY